MIAITTSFKDAIKAMHYTGVTSCSTTLIQKIGNRTGAMLVDREDERLTSEILPTVKRSCTTPASVMGVLVDGGRCNVWQNEKKLENPQWKEVKVGGFCNYDCTQQDKEGKPKILSKEYIARVDENSEKFGERLYREALYRNYEEAKIKIFLADGAKYNWEIQITHFPDAIGILDWHHGTGHLADAGKQTFGENTPEFYEWWEKAKAVLYEGDFIWLDELLFDCKKLCKKKEGKKKIAQEREYFFNNRKRIRYREFRNRGLPIGSGPIESGIKTTVNRRMKGSEKHWRKKRANNILMLRVGEVNNSLHDLYQLLGKVA